MKQGLRRRLATGLNATLVAVLVIAGVALVVDLAGRFRVRVDLSADGAHTLDADTLSALAEVDTRGLTVRITAFSSQRRKADEAMYRDRAVRDLLAELEIACRGVKTRFVDFDADRRAALDLNVKSYGTIVVQTDKDRIDIKDRDVFRRVRGADGGLEFRGEDVLARAIQQVISDQARHIYVLTGHGERSLTERGPTGIFGLTELYDRQGWEVVELDLLREAEGAAPSIPADADVVMIPGPGKPFSEFESGLLREYVIGGGRLAVFVEPEGYVPEIVERLGVARPSGWVAELRRVWPHVDWPVLGVGRHLITEDIDDVVTLVARAAPLRVRKLEGVHVDDLLTTSRRGWIERGGSPETQDEGIDEEGPVDVAYAVVFQAPNELAQRGRPGRALVFGDVDLISNDLLEQGAGNATFAVNAMRWLLGEDERMSLVGRGTPIRSLALAPADLDRIRWVVMGLVPLGAVLIGVLVWALRRRR